MLLKGTGKPSRARLYSVWSRGYALSSTEQMSPNSNLTAGMIRRSCPDYTLLGSSSSCSDLASVELDV